MRKTLAVPGEIVTCESGHYICQVAQPIVSGAVMMPDQFREWRPEDEPKLYDAVRGCSVCGADYIRGAERCQLHVSGEWRG